MSKNSNTRGRPSHRRNFRRRRGINAGMNNTTYYDSPDADKCTSFENLGNTCSSLNKMQNNSVVTDNRDFEGNSNFFRLSEKDSEPFKKEIFFGSARNSKSIDKLCNIASGEHPKNFDVSNKQNVDIPDKGINTVRDLLAKARSLVEGLEPSEVIKDCRLKVTEKTEHCIANHGQKIVRICSEISKVVGKDKIILEKHLANMKSQLQSFQQFQQQIFSDLTELYAWNEVADILNKTDEILTRVEIECMRFGKNLPAYSLKKEIQMALTKGQVAIISCDAVYYGNIIIPLLIHDMFQSDVIASCEVNDVLALSSAKNCAPLSDQKLGQLVDCEVGKENVTNKDTKIIYTTIQELFSSSLKDPLFSKYSCVVFNEFLHRSIETDILLTSLCECMTSRKDLKVILLVSIEETALKMEKYFSKVVSATLINTANLILPVQVIWKEAPCNSDDDILDEITSVCLAVHVLNGKGDILAFLPSKDDALKASALTASRLLEYSFRDAECVHISESSKGGKALLILEPKQGVRNIIFTCDGFEAVVFPNVSYVIDCGRIKEVCYDPQKKLEVQKMSYISRARAKIRRNCAGRTSSGVCYRIYSKENYVKNMACSELPELLTKSPLNSLAKIYQYKPHSALTLEFIESFPKHVKENAVKSLKSLEAVKNDRLTKLGERITKLPFLPRHSKLITLGIQWGIPLETIVVVSLFLVKGYVFKYRNNEEFKKKVDVAKLNFIQNDSDTCTFLNIYKQWTENNYSESWCADNCIEFSFLENVHAKVNEVCETVYKRMETSGLDKFTHDFKWSYLQELIFQCFRDNLCVYTGHYSSGYRSLTAQCIVFFHPSTSIPGKENLPQFIVYDKFISKTRNFVTHTTSVPEALVTQALKDGLLEVSHHDLFERNLVPCVIDHVGGLIMKKVLTKEKVRDLEEQIKNKTKSELIVIDPSVEKGNVTLYALPDSIQNAEAEMRKILRENAENLRDEKQTLILELRRGKSFVPISISWASGARISSVATQQNTYGNKSQSVSLDSASASNSEESTVHSCIHLTWLRRPCQGFGYIGFEKPGDFTKARRLGMRTIQVKDCDVDVQVNDKRSKQLYVSGLHPETTNSDLKEAIEDVLGNEVSVNFVNVILSHPYETSNDDIQNIKTEIKKLCQDLLMTLVEEVKVSKPKAEDVTMTTEVYLRNDSNLVQHAGALNSRLKFRNISVTAKPFYYSDLFCNVEVLRALEPRIQISLKNFEHNLHKSADVNSDDDQFWLEADTHDYLTAKLKLSAHSKKIVTDLRKIVQDLLEGDIITSKNVSSIHKLFCHGGHMWLETLQKSENIHIIDEYKTKTIRLYGSLISCNNAAHRIQKFLDNAEEEAVKHIVLADGKDNRILLKAIIQEYGVDLKKFIGTCGLRSAELDIRKCQLTLHGSADSIETAENELEVLAGQFNSSCLSDHQLNQEICPVCLCPALALTFRLENCGHLYCDACLKGLVTDVLIPLQCCAEGCGKDLILEDIRKILDCDNDKIEGLLGQSLKDYIAKNPNFVYCPAPDCTMFFDKARNSGSKWTCPLCQNAICIGCNAFDHPGMSCEMYQGTRKDSDYSFKVWNKTTPNCKICPVCGSAIEKTEGCNHMTCFVCKGHFCWLCLKAFSTGNEVYNHLPYCSNNQGR